MVQPEDGAPVGRAAWNVRSAALGVARLTALGAALCIGACANVGQQNGDGSTPGAGNAQAGTSNAATSGACVAASPANANPGASKPSATVASAAPTQITKKIPPTMYRVKRGDTLSGIAERNHVNVADLQNWNRMKPRAPVKVGQSLMVSSPQATREMSVAQKPATPAAASSSAAAAPSIACVPAPANGTASSASVATAAPPSPAEAREVLQETQRPASHVDLIWPAQGRVVESFQAGETRGIEIGGRSGDPIRAAADGKVMYAGTGLNAYGSLIIVQHNKDFLTAYSHNRRLLVRTGDVVKKGQLIAEMGDMSNSRVSLGFELRRDGKPVDPMPYLRSTRG